MFGGYGGRRVTQGSKYTDEDRERGLQALAEAGGNAEVASKACGIPARTLRDWKANEFADEFAELRREKRGDLIAEVWGTAAEALGILRRKLKGMKGKDLAITFGILTDKALVMGGEPDTIGEMRVREHRSDLERKLREAVEPSAEGDVPQEPDG